MKLHKGRGRFAKIAEAVGTRSRQQVHNYYYSHKCAMWEEEEEEEVVVVA